VPAAKRSSRRASPADLYSTYGFPIDLTELIAREQGFRVDAAGATAIVRRVEEADGPIDPAAAVDPVHRELARLGGKTTFTGYELEADEGHVVALAVCEAGAATPRTLAARVEAGSEVELVTDRTPFYAESGGQVGDLGTVRAGDAFGVVLDTQRPLGQTTVHRVRVERGSFAVGDRVELVVDAASRSATRRNHSATHLLHFALRTVLGEHAQQKGSRVGPDLLRFDFAHNRALSQEELRRVEDLVNGKILENAPVETEVLPIDEARGRGAVAIFEEKYGDVVRMLTMTRDSVELCGGTHCRALGDIGLFKIVSEAARLPACAASSRPRASRRSATCGGSRTKSRALGRRRRRRAAISGTRSRRSSRTRSNSRSAWPSSRRSSSPEVQRAAPATPSSARRTSAASPSSACAPPTHDHAGLARARRAAARFAGRASHGRRLGGARGECHRRQGPTRARREQAGDGAREGR